MKNVLKIFIATAVMGVMAVSAFAQGAGPAGAKGGQKAGGPGGPGGMRRGGMLDFDKDILAKLKLTPAQDKKVKELKEATKKKGEDLRKTMMAANKGGAKAGAAGGPGGRPKMSPEMREKFKAITEGYTNGLKKILTPTQFSDYEKQMKALREKMKAGRPGGAAAGKAKGKGTIKP